ncbi:MAG: methyltransferase domain-containing protein [Geodermatophilaceae bacterium]|nr:methyltransferase domain-containing protein [Geodermatophilaceae bacterium]
MTAAGTTRRAPQIETALELYAEGLADVSDPEVTDPDEFGHAHWFLRYEDGDEIPLRLSHWCSDDVPGDAGLVGRCSGATLDVGCGPGRLAAAVAQQGLPVLGLDISPAAVRIARNRGALVVQRSVFDALPGEGGWQHVLLADGNVGIGGDPARLLRRCAELIDASGSVLAELDAPGTVTRSCVVRIVSATGRRSDTFPWAHVGADQIEHVAETAGLAVVESWTEEGRWFASLRHR